LPKNGQDARRKSESRRFEKNSRGKANPFLPQNCFAPSELCLAFLALLFCRSTTLCVVARSARGTLVSVIRDSAGNESELFDTMITSKNAMIL
jgi:hypothetical protein